MVEQQILFTTYLPEIFSAHGNCRRFSRTSQSFGLQLIEYSLRRSYRVLSDRICYFTLLLAFLLWGRILFSIRSLNSPSDIYLYYTKRRQERINIIYDTISRLRFFFHVVESSNLIKSDTIRKLKRTSYIESYRNQNNFFLLQLHFPAPTILAMFLPSKC